MASGKDPLKVGIHLTVYVALYVVTVWLFGGLLVSVGGMLVGITGTAFLAALVANWLVLRIYHGRALVDIGLPFNRWSAENLALGLAGGMGAATLVLAPPLLVRAARLVSIPDDQPSLATPLFVALLLMLGAAGEELFYRGYGFQELITAVGPWATVVPVGVLFALQHGNNPGANYFSTFNTAGFGIAFGYAYLKSRDLWLPIGLHYGWNLALTLFGVNVSGLKMRVTGYEMSWTAGTLWSGGEYGPEASVLTSVVLVALFVYLYKMPIRRQHSPLTDPPAETNSCEPRP